MTIYKYPHADGSMSISGYVREQMEKLEEARQLQELRADKEWIEHLEAFLGRAQRNGYRDDEGNDRS